MLILLARGRDLADFDKSKSSRFTHRRLLKRAAAELLCIDGTEHARGSRVHLTDGKAIFATSGIGKPAVNRRKPLETARNDTSNSKNR